jgi:WXG100 family type VII secretion target
MQRAAARFDEVNRELDAMLKGLLAELEVLRGAWQGAGGRTFEQVKTQWAADQAAIHRSLAETAAAIRSAGQSYAATDDQAAGRMAATNPGISLPL